MFVSTDISARTMPTPHFCEESSRAFPVTPYIVGISRPKHQVKFSSPALPAPPLVLRPSVTSLHCVVNAPPSVKLARA